MYNLKTLFLQLCKICLFISFIPCCWCENAIPGIGNTWSLISATGEDDVVLMQEQTRVLYFNFTLPADVRVKLTSSSTDQGVFEISAGDVATILPNSSTAFNVTVKGVFIGRAKLIFHVNNPDSQQTGDNSNWNELPFTIDVAVKRLKTALNRAFLGVVIALVCLANVAMGCKTDIHVVKEILKKPIAPVTGLASQFILMPLISFTVGYVLKLDPAVALGLFATGCSPGGAASNIYTYFLDGNVSLSVTMTLVSTIAALGFIPLWLFSLGVHVIYSGSEISIPFTNIFTSLLGIVIPVGIGLIIQKKKPKWAKLILKLLRPLTVIFLLFVFTVGIYANLFIFKLFQPMTLLAGALLPYCGLAFGALVAFVVRQKPLDILTIAIETGIQNTGIAIVLLQLSLPTPDSDMALVAPVVTSLFTPLPLVIAMIVHIIRKRRKGENKDDEHVDISETGTMLQSAETHNNADGAMATALVDNDVDLRNGDTQT